MSDGCVARFMKHFIFNFIVVSSTATASDLIQLLFVYGCDPASQLALFFSFLPEEPHKHLISVLLVLDCGMVSFPFRLKLNFTAEKPK